jgi:hypothetical protein
LFSRRITWLLAGSAIAAFMFTVFSIARSPLPDLDEVYIASAALSLARHGRGVPSVLPSGPWNVAFPDAYGPMFFWPAAMSIRWLGLSAAAVRAVCLSGATAIALAAGWLTWRAGASRTWAVCVAAIIWFAPEIGRAATNGRMDTVAVALEIAAMAMLVAPADLSPRRAVANGVIAGVFAGSALLTTPRTILWAVGLTGAAAVAARHRRSARGALIATVTCGVCAAACVTIWTMAIGVGPVAYVLNLVTGVRDDAFNSVTTGVRSWSLHFVAIASLAGTLAVLLGLAVTRASAQDAAPRTLSVLWGWTLTAAAIYLVRVNHTFFREIYFVTPVMIVALATAGTTRVPADGRRALVVACAATAALFIALRLVKSAQIVESWKGRDPAAVETFFHTNVPPGSDVFGLSQYYFYAVERSGAHFKAYDAEPFGEPFPGSPTIGRPPLSMRADLRARVRGHLLIWPDEGESWPPAFECAHNHPVARWVPTQGAGMLSRLPIFSRFAGRLTYPATTIYRMPEDCPSD